MRSVNEMVENLNTYIKENCEQKNDEKVDKL